MQQNAGDADGRSEQAGKAMSTLGEAAVHIPRSCVPGWRSSRAWGLQARSRGRRRAVQCSAVQCNAAAGRLEHGGVVAVRRRTSQASVEQQPTLV